ncbi:carbonic anhydrase [Caulobacter vibrioides]|nr:carbonic anhydrase [Caulobacter vibrioides]YP_002519060.2 carbonic anhydrase [Caulobacter vibrioides NA1000]ACL97152.2 carbonic anhydrase [Caulobacter vibrioides NA1000]ATC30382.1 carbonic anhydrase [Caulobacter vibrioides]QXZ51912.1 carbonic anhydrase [Caulobacter vibrioides]
MVSRRLLLGALAGMAAPALAFAEGEGHSPNLLTKKGRRTASALKHQAGDKAALDKAMASVKPMEPDPAHAPEAHAPPQEVSPDEALGRLKHGNGIFARGGANLMLPSLTRINELSKGQKPFAIIVGCSDSRVPPELVFNCNLGELFVVRVAGSTVSREGLGSIIYAVEHLGAPLIVVLGHTKCGAVGAAVDVATKSAHLHGALHEMVLPILPAVTAAEAKHPADLQDAAIRQNVRDVAARLKVADGVLAEKLGEGRLKVVSACYDLASGLVAFDA